MAAGMLDDLLRRIKVLHEEQRPRGDQLEVPDEYLLQQFPRLGIKNDLYETLDTLKRALKEHPRLVAGKWIAYDSGISALTIESVPSPERLEWLAEKVRLDLASRLQERIKELSWKGFEQFVKDVVENSGKDISVQGTGKSHDGGVDFYGERASADDDLSLPVRIVGQAKRWKARATRDDVAAFIGNVDMKPLPKRGVGQILGIFISCSGFTDDESERPEGLDKAHAMGRT